MNGESSSMCIAFSILMLGYILSVGTHVGCQDLNGQQNPGGIRGGIGGIPGRILPRIVACLRWDPAWDPTQNWWDPTRGVP